MKRIIGAVCALAVGTASFAQNEEDVLRYSRTVPGGTARGWGMAGALGAVGADPSAASINPAGFGLYNASEFSMTLGFEVNNADATHYGTQASAGQQRMSLNNMALVLNYPSKTNGDWRGGTFGISYDRQASYHWKEFAKGDHVPSTILQRFVNEADGTSVRIARKPPRPHPLTATPLPLAPLITDRIPKRSPKSKQRHLS